MSDPERSSPPDEELNIEQALAEAETTLSKVKERYQNIQTAQQQQPQLQEQLQQLESKAQSLKKESPHTEELQQLQTDIDAVKEQLEIVEFTLESQLFKWLTWRDKQEWFWQFLRFSGLGFGAALLLKHLSQ